jgi:hypothetical protein
MWRARGLRQVPDGMLGTQTSRDTDVTCGPESATPSVVA